MSAGGADRDRRGLLPQPRHDAAAVERIEIGDHVMFANGCFVGDADHRYDDPEVPDHLAGLRPRGPVTIGSNCWFGVNCVVTGRREIGERAVIGANSVVTEDIPPRVIAAGAPAQGDPRDRVQEGAEAGVPAMRRCVLAIVASLSRRCRLAPGREGRVRRPPWPQVTGDHRRRRRRRHAGRRSRRPRATTAPDHRRRRGAAATTRRSASGRHRGPSSRVRDVQAAAPVRQARREQGRRAVGVVPSEAAEACDAEGRPDQGDGEVDLTLEDGSGRSTSSVELPVGPRWSRAGGPIDRRPRPGHGRAGRRRPVALVLGRLDRHLGAAGVGAVATQSLAEPAYGPRPAGRIAAAAGRAGARPAPRRGRGRRLPPGRGDRRRRRRRRSHRPGCIRRTPADVGRRLQRPGEHDGAARGLAGRWRAPSRPRRGRSRALLAALEAAEARAATPRAPVGGAGGRPRQRRALGRRMVDLRVEDHPEPLAELARLLDLHDAYALANRGDDLAARAALRGGRAATRGGGAGARQPRADLLVGAGPGAGGRPRRGRRARRASDRAPAGWPELLPGSPRSLRRPRRRRAERSPLSASLDDDRALARAVVEVDQHELLPGAQREAAVEHRDHLEGRRSRRAGGRASWCRG